MPKSFLLRTIFRELPGYAKGRNGSGELQPSDMRPRRLRQEFAELRGGSTGASGPTSSSAGTFAGSNQPTDPTSLHRAAFMNGSNGNGANGHGKNGHHSGNGQGNGHIRLVQAIDDRHPPTPAAPPGLALIGPLPGRNAISEWSLVFRSIKVKHDLTARGDALYFLVEERDHLRASRAIAKYLEENEDWPPRVNRSEPLAYADGSRAALTTGVVLTLLFLFMGSGGAARVGLSTFGNIGVSDAVKIFHGQVWRSVTALTLHADVGHLIGNVFAGGVFLWALARRIGNGRAVFYGLLAGTLGNLANAAMHFHGHRSIGASTAVFGLVGLLVATQIKRNREVRARRWTDRVGPVVGGLAILGAMGSSPSSDLWAHFYGLIAGLVVGLGIAFGPLKATKTRTAVQVAYGVVAAVLVMGSWALALRVG